MSTGYLLNLFAALLLSMQFLACTTVHENFRPFAGSAAGKKTEQIKVAVVLPEELCSWFYRYDDFQAFRPGPVICRNARSLAQKAFSGPGFFSAREDVDSSGIDAVAVLRPVFVSLYHVRRLPLEIYMDVGLSWDFLRIDNKKRYRFTIYGKGFDCRTFGSRSARYRDSMQRTMDDLAKQMYMEMAGAYEKALRNSEATARIRAVISNYRTGVTTYSQYLSAKTKEWHIFALNESARYDGCTSNYILNPRKRKHISSICGRYSFWSWPHPVISSLRPSVYLSDSRIDHAKISKVYIKEEIGSVYDGFPLCELVFEGENFKSAVLTQCNCMEDRASDKTYVSRDIYHDYTFSKTVQQWLKLRPGMPRHEFLSILGYPGRMEYSALTGGTLYEYGYGRVFATLNKGLRSWQLGERKTER